MTRPERLWTWLAVGSAALAVALGLGRPRPPRPPDDLDPAALRPELRAILDRDLRGTFPRGRD